VRKGMLVGCKVTLRSESLNNFINRLSFVFSRMEKFQPSNDFFIKNFVKKSVSYPNFRFNLGELVLFYPIELGLGLHTDIQQLQFNIMFNTFSIEERFFLLRYYKVPVLI
jgi:ribosomal protein L5